MRRDQGEPSIIAGMTLEVMRSYHVDARRVYVAGMSAGGAMAAIMAANYPELYAAVGIHSGAPYGAAQNFFAAIAAMKDGSAVGTHLPDKRIPVIVFHGDQDVMVNARNAEQIISQWLRGPAPARRKSSTAGAQEGHGRAFTRTTYRDAAGRALAENWLVHDAGHAWSGGGPEGSFADPMGPDASREMLRFFLKESAEARSQGGLLTRIKNRLRVLKPSGGS
jgi:poly(3-hydroxybutyrate) depolymerase